jgi:hypothetical protein
MRLALLSHGQYLQQNCSAYESPEGIEDLHAADRHSHITGLVRHGATLLEAKETGPPPYARSPSDMVRARLAGRACAASRLRIPYHKTGTALPLLQVGSCRPPVTQRFSVDFPYLEPAAAVPASRCETPSVRIEGHGPDDSSVM